MRFASIVHDGAAMAVAVEADQAIPLAGIAELGAATPLSLLRDPPLDRASALPSAHIRRRPVIPRPGKVICVGLNYAAHIEETKRDDIQSLFETNNIGLIAVTHAVVLGIPAQRGGCISNISSVAGLRRDCAVSVIRRAASKARWWSFR